MSKFDFLNFTADGIIPDAEEFMAKQKTYASLKRDELEGISESEIVLAVTSWIEGKFSEDWHDMCDVINSLPTPCLNIYCANYVTKEVLNGGFAQAFFNSSRDYIGAAAEGFRVLEYSELADIIESALKVNFDSGRKISGRSIIDFLEFAGSDEYNELDEKFCKEFDVKKFDSLAYGYIMKYKKYFGEEV